MSADIISMIPVLKIAIRDDRLRAVDESAVTALRNDIEANGLNQPIMVRTLKNGRFELIDGGHRLEAVVFLGWTKVQALVTNCSVEDARLRTALANLTRAELTMLDRALHVWRVKSVWMKQHPEAKHGGFRKAGECQVATAATWTEAIPGKAGVSDRTLADAAKIGGEIYGPAANLLVGTEVADNQKELLALIKYSPELQRSIAEKIAAGEAKTVAQAVALDWVDVGRLLRTKRVELSPLYISLRPPRGGHKHRASRHHHHLYHWRRYVGHDPPAGIRQP